MKTLQLPPGNFGLPVIGETLSFFSDPNFTKKRYQKYGSIFKTNLAGKPTVVMVGPEAAEFLLASHMECFSWRQGWPKNFKVLLGESLFLMDGEEHRQKRRLMMPAFHGPALVNYLNSMSEITVKYLQTWVNKKELTWLEEFKKLTFDIASTLLLGTPPGEDSVRLSKLFADLSDGLFALNPLPLPITKYGKAINARNQILEHLAKVVKERQQNSTKDVLSLLMQARDEEGNSLGEKELIAQAVLMLFAGHETTTSMVTWLCLELARHPEIMQRAREEQMQLAPCGALSLEQLGQMSYLEQVLWEVERKYPPAGGGFRGVIKEFEFQGYRVPAGWQALYSINATHQLEEIYPQPDLFDPERFNSERQEHKKRPFSLIGFGGGPRVCIGIAFAKMEMKIIAAHLLRGYDWEILPHQSLDVVYFPSSRPKDGLKVKFSSL